MWGEGEEPRLKVQKWAKTRHLWLPASQPASQPSSHRILIHSFRTSLCRRSDCKLTRITNDGEPSEQKHRSFLEKCGSIFSRKFKIGCDINSSNSGCTLFFFFLFIDFFSMAESYQPCLKRTIFLADRLMPPDYWPILTSPRVTGCSPPLSILTRCRQGKKKSK